jgi:hypothetical protein
MYAKRIQLQLVKAGGLSFLVIFKGFGLGLLEFLDGLDLIPPSLSTTFAQFNYSGLAIQEKKDPQLEKIIVARNLEDEWEK